MDADQHDGVGASGAPWEVMTMSDPHQSDGAANGDGEGRSAVQVEDAPTTHGDEHDGTASPDDAGAPASGDESGDTAAEEHGDTDTVAEHEDAEHSDVEHEEPAAEVDDSDDDTDDALDEDDDEDDDEDGGRSRIGLFSAIGVAAVAVIGVLVLLAAFVWPDFTGPGKPDEVASQAVSALAAKDAGRINTVSCKRLDGKPSEGQLPPEELQLIQSAVPSGPVTRSLDSEARQPVSLTLSAGGQTQTAPVELVFAVNHGNWCMNSISLGQ